MKRLLVPVDFSPAMEQVLALARELASALGAELHLVHVREIAAAPVYPAATVGYPGIGAPEMGLSGGIALVPPPDLADAVPSDQTPSRLEALARELGAAGMTVTAHEAEGSVVEEILRTADVVAADLIIMGSHGHGAVYNLLVGSATEGVMKARRRPILLVPTSTATPQ